jgi:hypothetical protein
MVPLPRSPRARKGGRLAPSRNDCTTTVRAQCESWVFDYALKAGEEHLSPLLIPLLREATSKE